MKRFICKSCFNDSFSSSSKDNQKDVSCPYCGADALVELSPGIKIGQLLCLMGIINQNSLEIALERQRQVNEKIGTILILLNMISNGELNCALKIQSSMI